MRSRRAPGSEKPFKEGKGNKESKEGIQKLDLHYKNALSGALIVPSTVPQDAGTQ